MTTKLQSAPVAAPPTENQAGHDGDWWKAPSRLAWIFSQTSFPHGDLASLRRMDHDNPTDIVFWRMMHRQGLLNEGSGPLWENRWAAIMKAIAIMTRNTQPILCAHDPEIPVGRALWGTREERPLLTERRLEKMLKLRDEQLVNIVVAVARLLRSEEAPLNWTEFARIIIGDAFNEPMLKKARNKIARDYFRTQRYAKQNAEEDERNQK